MRFLSVLVLTSSAASASVLPRATTVVAGADQDIAALFTGFSDGECTTVTTKERPVTFSKHDGGCIELSNPAGSLTAVDAHPELSSDSDSDDDTGKWYFYAFTTRHCNLFLPAPDEAAESAVANDENTFFAIDDDTCHTAPSGKTFKSILMYSVE